MEKRRREKGPAATSVPAPGGASAARSSGVNVRDFLSAHAPESRPAKTAEMTAEAACAEAATTQLRHAAEPANDSSESRQATTRGAMHVADFLAANRNGGNETSVHWGNSPHVPSVESIVERTTRVMEMRRMERQLEGSLRNAAADDTLAAAPLVVPPAGPPAAAAAAAANLDALVGQIRRAAALLDPAAYTAFKAAVLQVFCDGVDREEVVPTATEMEDIRSAMSRRAEVSGYNPKDDMSMAQEAPSDDYRLDAADY